MLNKIGEIITNDSESNCLKILWQQSTRFNLNMTQNKYFTTWTLKIGRYVFVKRSTVFERALLCS